MAISKITENGLTITDLTVADDLTVSDDLLLASDGAILKFGTDADVTLTHVHNTGLTLNTALTATTGTFSGILKTDDTTDATSTTDGSLQTDGGLSVAKDAVIGNDLLMKSDSSAIKFGADSEMVLTHSADAGLTLLQTGSAGSLLTLGTTSTSVSDEAFIGGIDFASGSSPTVQARVHGKQEGTAEVGGHLSFETRASGGSLSERLKIDSIGRILATTTGARSIIGRGAYTGITVDNGSTTSVAGNNGVLFNMVMVSTGGGFGAVYSMAYNSTVNLIHGTGNFSASSGTSSSTNVYKSSGSHAVTLQNNTGSSVTYYILCIVSYD